MTAHAEIVEFAKAMLKAGESGDPDTIRALYQPDATLWINTTGVAKTLDEHLTSAKTFRKNLQSIRYIDERITPFDGGYVVQFRSVAEIKGGGTIDLPVCLVV